MQTKNHFTFDDLDFQTGGMKQTILTGKECTREKKKLTDRRRSAFLCGARRLARQHLQPCLSRAAKLRGDTKTVVHFDIVVSDGRFSHTERYSLTEVGWSLMPFTGTVEQTLNVGWRFDRRDRSIPADFLEALTIR